MRPAGLSAKRARRSVDTTPTAERTRWTAEIEACRQKLLHLAERVRRGARPAFRCFYVDPPWAYDNNSIQGSCPYPGMAPEDLEALPFPDLAHPDGATLFLWVTAPKLVLALHLIRHWGFTYRDTMFWRKVDSRGKMHLGTGHWVRGCVELLVLATCGRHPCLNPGAHVPQVLVAPRGVHSAKPQAMRHNIAKFQPAVRPGEKIELFARGSGMKGWARWGLDLTDYLIDI